MNKTAVLQGIVAKIGGTEPGCIGSDFSLRTSRFHGSIRRAALAAAIRRELAIDCPLTYSVATFGELEHALFGTDQTAAWKSTANIPSVSAPISYSSAPGVHCGVDIEMISELPEAADFREHEFYQQSFSPEEMAYCLIQENPRMHFAARWCAKEALCKCDPAFRSEKMSNLEVLRNENGEVSLRHRNNGSTQNLPHSVSLSHTDSIAIAFVVKSAVGAMPDTLKPDSTAPKAEPTANPPRNSPDRPLTLYLLAWLVAMATAILALSRTFK